MNFWSDELKNDIVDARRKLRKLRKELEGKSIDEKAKIVGKSAADFIADTWDDAESILFDITTKLYEGFYEIKEDLADDAQELGDELSELREKLKEIRSEISGEEDEEKARDDLADAEEKMNNIVERMKK